MELDEMRNVWTELSAQLDKQKKLTDNVIMQMTQTQYRARISRIRTPEIISSFFCVAIVVLIAVNSAKFDTAYVQICAAISAVLLSALPVLSLTSLQRMNNIRIERNDFKQTVMDYATSKRKFLFVQKLSFYLGFVLLITSLPVAVVILDGKNGMDSPVWLWYAPIGILFFILFSRWVYGFYVKTAAQAEQLLHEIKEQE